MYKYHYNAPDKGVAVSKRLLEYHKGGYRSVTFNTIELFKHGKCVNSSAPTSVTEKVTSKMTVEPNNNKHGTCAYSGTDITFYIEKEGNYCII